MATPYSAEALEAKYQLVEKQALERSGAQQQPRAILLGGQPGSGKSYVTGEALRELDPRGGAVLIDADQMRERNPQYIELMRTDPMNAADRTHPVAAAWADRLRDTAIEQRRNLVVDGTMRNPEAVNALATRLKAAGYNVEARVMAVNPEVSYTRARLRYEQQAEQQGGVGRFVNRTQHDNAYAGVAQTVAKLESERNLDAIRLVDSAQRTVYSNQQVDGQWKQPAQAAQMLDAERSRAWTHGEQKAFTETLEKVQSLTQKRMENYRDSVPRDAGELAQQVRESQAKTERLEQGTAHQRATAFDQSTKREALQRFPELDGAYKQLQEAKAGQGADLPQDQRDRLYADRQAGLSEQLHRGRIPEGAVTVDESRRVIDMAAEHRGLVVREAKDLHHDVKGEVVATSSHHALVKMSDMVAVRYEKSGLDRDVQAGERVTIQQSAEQGRVYDQGKEPPRESARDQGRDFGR